MQSRFPSYSYSQCYSQLVTGGAAEGRTSRGWDGSFGPPAFRKSPLLMLCVESCLLSLAAISGFWRAGRRVFPILLRVDLGETMFICWFLLVSLNRASKSHCKFKMHANLEHLLESPFLFQAHFIPLKYVKRGMVWKRLKIVLHCLPRFQYE